MDLAYRLKRNILQKQIVMAATPQITFSATNKVSTSPQSHKFPFVIKTPSRKKQHKPRFGLRAGTILQFGFTQIPNIIPLGAPLEK